MILDNSPLHTYVLINTILRPCYAFIKKVNLTEYEAKTKNYAFGMNGVNKKYTLKEDWK